MTHSQGDAERTHTYTFMPLKATKRVKHRAYDSVLTLWRVVGKVAQFVSPHSITQSTYIVSSAPNFEQKHHAGLNERYGLAEPLYFVLGLVRARAGCERASIPARYAGLPPRILLLRERSFHSIAVQYSHDLSPRPASVSTVTRRMQ